MTRCKLLQKGGKLTGFVMEGHTGSAPAGEDVVCAALSSAAYLVANTLGGSSEVRDGYMAFHWDGDDTLLRGFAAHMEAIRDQYPEYVQIDYTEE
ncbi:MAG: ribosomal-processing cysteine protease Prp [Oscillospiraceae bacterium]|nr:ribosomal-processing cysteine protease Prp [Oscillospiraceae bacterium]